MSGARTILDQVHSLAKIDELTAAPGRYAEAVAAELPPLAGQGGMPARDELEARDHALALALAHIDATTTRLVRIRIDHALASDPSADAALPVPTRNVFASTLGKYAGDLELLGDRVRDVAARGRARDPAAVAELVVGAARDTLALREALRAPVLELVRAHARELLPTVRAAAIDRKRDDAERTRWSTLRRDLETLVEKPEHVSTAPLASRLAALPAELDDLPPEPEVSFADMIELD